MSDTPIFDQLKREHRVFSEMRMHATLESPLRGWRLYCPRCGYRAPYTHSFIIPTYCPECYGMSDTPTREAVDDLLAEVYTADGRDIWWQSRNRNLGGIPDLMWQRNIDDDRGRVLAEAERVADGLW